MASVRPIKLTDLGGGAGRLDEIPDSDKIPSILLDLIAAAVAFGALWCTYGGTANAITLTSSLANATPTSLTDRAQYRFRATSTNTGAATINVAGLGAKTAVTVSGQALPAGYIRTDVDTICTYESGADRFVVGREIEYITNSNGEGTKFADGTMLFKGSVDQLTSSTANTNATLPIAAADATSIISGNSSIASGSTTGSVVCEFTTASTTGLSCKVLVHQATTVAMPSVTRTIKYGGWGRWY